MHYGNSLKERWSVGAKPTYVRMVCWWLHHLGLRGDSLSPLFMSFHSLPAKLVLGKALYEYVASGTDDEQSEYRRSSSTLNEVV